MKFSIVTIAYNEAENIVKLASSAEKFMKAGGKLFLLDTGSTDGTPDVARKLGFQTFETITTGVKFEKTLNTTALKQWRAKNHIVKDVVHTPTTFFSFDDARNFASELPDLEDMIFFMDGCDKFINFDYEKVNELITQGYEKLTVYQDYQGLIGVINRFYNRKKGFWRDHIHEYIEIENVKDYTIPKETLLIYHDKKEKDRSAKYMAGLIASHIKNPTPRLDYYIGRELYYQKFYVDARKLLQKRFDCIDIINGIWFPEERAAAMCMIARSYKQEYLAKLELIAKLESIDKKEGGRINNAKAIPSEGDLLKEKSFGKKRVKKSVQKSINTTPKENESVNPVIKLQLLNDREKEEIDEKVHKCYMIAYEVKPPLKEVLFEICQYHFVKQNWDLLLKFAEECLQLIKNSSNTFFENERFTDPENLSRYLYHGHYNSVNGQKDMAIYYWRKFCKSRKFAEEKHEYWKFTKKYQYFPSIPYIITEVGVSQDGTSQNIDYYKYIKTIEDTQKEISPSSKELLINSILKKYIPPCVSSIEISPSPLGVIALSKKLYPAEIFAFENNKKKFQELTANVYINGRDNITTYPNLCYIIDNTFENFNFADIGVINIGIISPYYSVKNILLKLIFDFDKKGALTQKNIPIISILKNDIPLEDEESDDFELLIKNIYTKINLKDALFFMPTNLYNYRKIAIVCYYNFNKESIIESIGFKPDRSKAIELNRWCGNSFKNSKIEQGESEQAVVNLAEALVKRGFIVDVWGNPEKNYLWSGGAVNPRYLDYKYFHGFFDSSDYYTSVVWWRYAGEIRKNNSVKNILWLQDFIFPKIDLDLTDSIVFLSETQKNGILENYPTDHKENLEKISHVIPNAISLNKIYNSVDINFPLIDKIKYRCVYLNNHAIGLDILLDAWPIIKEKFPSASLYIYHNIQTWGLKTPEEENLMRERILNTDGVTLVGSLNQQSLHEELLKSQFWLYPCIHEEPFNIQGVQAVYAGVIPIVSDQPFLRKISTDKCCSGWPITIDGFTQKCIEVMSMTNEQLSIIREESINKAKNYFYDLDIVGKAFEKLF